MPKLKVGLIERRTGEGASSLDKVSLCSYTITPEGEYKGRECYTYCRHKGENPPSDFAQRWLIGESKRYAFIDADGVEEAIDRFYTDWEGANVLPLEAPNMLRALRIDPDVPIRRLPDCPLMHQNKEGEYICGELERGSEDGNGQYGMCVLAGYDPPPDCPVAASSIWELNMGDEVPCQRITHRGCEYRVIDLSQTPTPDMSTL